MTDLGRAIVRVDGTARQIDGIASAKENSQYVTKYTERIAAMFGAADNFAELFSTALLITPTRLWA